MSGTDAANYFEQSYLKQRRGMAILAFLLPTVFLASSIIGGTALHTSLSSYYWSGHNWERSWFVGVLCATAAYLVSYMGFSTRENWALNIAGVSAVLVVFFPMASSGNDCITSGFSWHGTFAGILFGCISYVCIFMSETTLKQISDEPRQSQFRILYRWCAGAMLGSMILALIYHFLLPKNVHDWCCKRDVVFWCEAFGVWGFSAFWYIKTRELDSKRSWIPFR